jgi:hypothetical protein
MAESRVLPVLPLRDIVVLSEHDRTALRRPREIRARARRRHEGRQADPACHTEERRRRTTPATGDIYEVGTVGDGASNC